MTILKKQFKPKSCYHINLMETNYTWKPTVPTTLFIFPGACYFTVNLGKDQSVRFGNK